MCPSEGPCRAGDTGCSSALAVDVPMAHAEPIAPSPWLQCLGCPALPLPLVVGTGGGRAMLRGVRGELSNSSVGLSCAAARLSHRHPRLTEAP